MKKRDINWKEISEFLKTPRGKAVAFFGFYFIFFLGIMVLARTGNNHSNINNQYNNNKPYNISFDKILDSNYHFKYEISFDQNSFIYEGDRNGNKELFTLGVDKCYRNEEDYLKNTNGLWLKSDNPYIMKEFLDIHKISSILNVSTYISKTDYESGMKVYNFQVTTNTLVKLFENVLIDLDDGPNEIIFKTDEDGNVNVIKFDLSSYCKYKNLSLDKGEVILNYDRFGEIEEINDPV